MVRKCGKFKKIKKAGRKATLGEKMALEYNFALVNFTASSILEGKDGDVIRADTKEKAGELLKDLRETSGLPLHGLDITDAEVEGLVEEAHKIIKYMNEHKIKPIKREKKEEADESEPTV